MRPGSSAAAPAPTTANVPLSAVMLVLGATLCFSVLDSLFKYLSQRYPVGVLVWARYLVPAIVLGAVLYPRMRSGLVVTARWRLQILRETEDGFRIAEEDLAMRGAGDLIGTAQSGLPRFRVADMERQSALMAVAQTDARALLAADPALDSARGKAARVLLWLLDQDRAIRLITVG